MAFSTRIFLLVDTDRLYRLPGSRFAAMLSKPASHAIPHFASQRVRAAEAIVELVDWRPLKVIRMVFFMLGFDERGVVDADALMRQAAAALDTLHAVQPFNEFSREAKVVDGRSRFAVSGGRWRPTPALQALFHNAALEKKKMPLSAIARQQALPSSSGSNSRAAGAAPLSFPVLARRS